MTIKKFLDVKEWIEFSKRYIVELKQEVVSFHIDQLGFCDMQDLIGDQLLQSGCHCLVDIVKHLDEHEFFHSMSSVYPMIVIPLGYSDEIVFWDKKLIQNLGINDEPASVYLCQSENIFNIDDQEYRCRIDSPHEEVMGLYRCHQSFEDFQKGWEFSMDIYLLPRNN
ncbi:MAG: hypothetical protein ACXW1U_20065 [Methylobacter sp.]|jgi:hypothetical protein